jgi:hypothetical protein
MSKINLTLGKEIDVETLYFCIHCLLKLQKLFSLDFCWVSPVHPVVELQILVTTYQIDYV